MELDLNDIHVFAEVVRQQGFSAAGRVLDLPPSSVSRRVARLEERLGHTLLRRTTRQVSLTDAGRIYFDRVARISADVAEAERAVAELSEVPSGRIRVTAPAGEASFLWHILRPFLRANPAVELDLLFTPTPVDLVAAGIDVALRGGTPPDSLDYTARLLADMHFVLAASPAYLEARGTPECASDFEEHDALVVDPFPPWQLVGPNGPEPLRPRVRLRSTQYGYVQSAAVDGMGIAMLFAELCPAELESRALVEILPGRLPYEAPFWAVYPTRHVTAAVRALVDHLVEAFS